jgi:hypothetical protein
VALQWFALTINPKFSIGKKTVIDETTSHSTKPPKDGACAGMTVLIEKLG